MPWRKARTVEVRLRSDLAAAVAKESSATKTAAALQVERRKLTAQAEQYKANADKLNKELADTSASAANGGKVGRPRARESGATRRRRSAAESRQSTARPRFASSSRVGRSHQEAAGVGVIRSQARSGQTCRPLFRRRSTGLLFRQVHASAVVFPQSAAIPIGGRSISLFAWPESVDGQRFEGCTSRI